MYSTCTCVWSWHKHIQYCTCCLLIAISLHTQAWCNWLWGHRVLLTAFCCNLGLYSFDLWLCYRYRSFSTDYCTCTVLPWMLAACIELLCCWNRRRPQISAALLVALRANAVPSCCPAVLPFFLSVISCWDLIAAWRADHTHQTLGGRPLSSSSALPYRVAFTETQSLVLPEAQVDSLVYYNL